MQAPEKNSEVETQDPVRIFAHLFKSTKETSIEIVRKDSLVPFKDDAH